MQNTPYLASEKHSPLDTWHKLRGCLHVKFHPGLKSSLSMVKCLFYYLQVFYRMKFHSGMNSFLSNRQGWNFIPGWKKKNNRRVNTSSQDEILKWVCFFNFWHIYSNMLSKVNMFEHNESMNITKHKVKSEKKKDEHNKYKIKMSKHCYYFYYFLCEVSKILKFLFALTSSFT